MKYSLFFHPKALDEYNATSKWYEERQEGLGLRFEESADKKIKQILRNPLTFAKDKGSYRQAKTKSFPFVIVYKLSERKKEVYISAIYHTKRNPVGKYRRRQI